MNSMSVTHALIEERARNLLNTICHDAAKQFGEYINDAHVEFHISPSGSFAIVSHKDTNGVTHTLIPATPSFPSPDNSLSASARKPADKTDTERPVHPARSSTGVG